MAGSHDAARAASISSSSAPTASRPTATSPTRSAPTASRCWRREHGIPFYVAAPLSTIDLDTPDGSQIPIEERNAREVTHVGSSRLAPEGARIRNPAFDVTPRQFVTGIITERGIARAPYTESLATLDVAAAAGSAAAQWAAAAARVGSVQRWQEPADCRRPHCRLT